MGKLLRLLTICRCILLLLHFFCREDASRSYLNEALDEASRTHRGRSKTVNIQMTFISWILELITGITIFGLMALTSGGNGYVAVWPFVLSHIIIYVNFILIPVSYLLHTEVNRSLIIAEGWYNGIRKAISPPSQQNQMELDAEREDKDNEVETPAEAGLIPRPILSISGNIDAIAKTRNHDMYLSELNNLSERITQLNTKENGISRNKNPPSLGIPIQLDTIESLDNEICDNIETIVLHEQAQHERTKCKVNFSASRNNWI